MSLGVKYMPSHEDLSFVVCYFVEKHRSDSDIGKGICLFI